MIRKDSMAQSVRVDVIKPIPGRQSMNEKELVQNIVKEVGIEADTVEKIFNITIDEIVKSLKNTESVTIKNFGRFYIRPGDSQMKVFKFSPSQRLRKIFGWSSTYKGKA